ncbi:hypothetical protein Moror_12474 [Moniliophthora roreri MCA 2997]|uniref:DUF6533 domain-containing protein n=1 Tax=Moniliophthora roreri (strain MCA 2997) TaxID=1381753 RepID=V2XT91_MONRO|nr:hypothetical protein Moror_12474 [Moniliophthora roreri MCA 2997]
MEVGFTIEGLPLEEVISIGGTSINLGRYSAASVYALAIYDWLISTHDEYDLIWMTPQWTTIKFAYFICRYYTLLVFPVYLWAWLGDFSMEFCKKVVHPLYGFMPIFQLSSQAVMVIRTYAFTGRSTHVLVFLITCLVVYAAADVWLFGSRFVVPEELYIIFGESGCFANDQSVETQGLWKWSRAVDAGVVMLAAFVMDLFMMMIIVVHCIRTRSTQGSLGRFFLMQGIVVFISMSILNLWTGINYLSTSRQWNGTGLPMSLVLSNVLACRLILSLRRRVMPTESHELRLQSRLVREALQTSEED